MFNTTFMPVVSSVYSNLNMTLSIPIGTNIFITNTTSYLVYIYTGAAQPNSNLEFYPLDYNESVEIPPSADTVWVRSENISTNIMVQYSPLAIKPYSSVTSSTTSNIPDGVFIGTRAMTVQGYTESNVKNGVQFNTSRRVVSLAGNTNSDSIFLTGAKPVILKARKIGYTGNGVSASIYTSPTFTGGITASITNPNNINPAPSTITLLSSPVITNIGTLTTAIAYSEGNITSQGRGNAEATLGEEVIMRPNTAYLLRVTSLDSAAQNFNAYLSWYEGSPDLPRP
jgi:hypothetical protein